MVDDGYSCEQTSFGWVAVKAYSGYYTWEEARTKCSQDGTGGTKAELAAPRSSTENEWFVNKATELGLSYFWLGLTDEDLEGTWTNQHGLTQTYFNWDAGQPGNSGNNEDCAATGGSWGYKWHDYTCASSSVRHNLLCTYIEGL